MISINTLNFKLLKRQVFYFLPMHSISNVNYSMCAQHYKFAVRKEDIRRLAHLNDAKEGFHSRRKMSAICSDLRRIEYSQLPITGRKSGRCSHRANLTKQVRTGCIMEIHYNNQSQYQRVQK